MLLDRHDGANGKRRWSWRKFRVIEASSSVDKLLDYMMAIFQADEDVETVAVTDDFPDLGSSDTTDLHTMP